MISVIKKTAIFICFFISSLIYGEGCFATIMRTPPYLQTPTDTSMIVRWVTSVNCRGYVEYAETREDILNGNAKKIYMFREDGMGIGNTTIHRIVLQTLMPETTYYYRVGSEPVLAYGPHDKDKKFGPAEETEIYSFKTFVPPALSRNYKILFFNDFHYELSDEVRRLLTPDPANYDLAIFNGDFFTDPSTEDEIITWINTYSIFAHSHEIPCIYVRGNHEVKGAAAHLLKKYVEYVDAGRSYGAINMGDMRLIFLDVGEDMLDANTRHAGLAAYEPYRRKQKEFLEKELNSTEFMLAAKRILIHHAPFSLVREINRELPS
ncbi:MAG: fibronectin type III domain-containing protein [Candidatus Azobacteroides sp.]|nr:fibronectin type III domain-containing protein [Candidatus Azobacteroides sp.]